MTNDDRANTVRFEQTDEGLLFTFTQSVIPRDFAGQTIDFAEDLPGSTEEITFLVQSIRTDVGYVDSELKGHLTFLDEHRIRVVHPLLNDPSSDLDELIHGSVAIFAIEQAMTWEN